MTQNLAHSRDPSLSRPPRFSSPVTSGDEGLLVFKNFQRHYNYNFEQKWEVEVLSKLVEFTNLPTDWDGYGGAPVKRDAAMFVVEVLSHVMTARTPIPQVVPSNVGGVQIEWHTRGIDLEFHVTAPYDGDFYFEDLQTAKIDEGELNGDLSRLQEAVRILSSR